MYHYTYLLEFADGMKYVGVHSTHIPPELDTRYLGSGRALPPRNPKTCKKRVLATYPTREEAIEAELHYITSNQCCESDKYYNLRKTSTDLHGRTKETCAGIATTAEKLRGRKIGKMSKYAANHLKGEERTPAQKAGAKAMRKALTGKSNPATGHHGISNSGFTSWYSIDPDGNYEEHKTETKQEFAMRHGRDPQSVVNRCRPQAEHVRAIKGKWKGWLFGNLPD